MGRVSCLENAEKAALKEGILFPHLEEAYVSWYDTENGIGSSFIHPLLKSPSMRKVRDCNVVEPRDHEDPNYFGPGALRGDTIQPRCSHVTHIDLLESNVAEGIRDLIGAYKALRSFRIVHYGAIVSYEGFEPRKIFLSLPTQKQTLEAIWVDMEDDLPGGGDHDDEWMGSFHDFTALKFLLVGLDNLVGINEHGLPERELRDVLPSSLNALCLRVRGGDALDRILSELADLAVSETFPNMTAITLESFNPIDDPVNVAKTQSLQQKCRGRNFVSCL